MVWNINFIQMMQEFQQGLDVSRFAGDIRQRPDWLNRYIAESIFELSQQWCPVDTGRLKNSGEIFKNSIGTYSIRYSTPYAVYVHEIEENRHIAPTRSHWLEDAAYNILNRFETQGLSFTFEMDLNENNVTLNIDALGQSDFDFNRNYGQYVDDSFYDNKFHDIEPKRKSGLNVKPTSMTSGKNELTFDEMG